MLVGANDFVEKLRKGESEREAEIAKEERRVTMKRKRRRRELVAGAALLADSWYLARRPLFFSASCAQIRKRDLCSFLSSHFTNLPMTFQLDAKLNRRAKLSLKAVSGP